MKRYLFLKLCLTILCYGAAASPRSQVSDNAPTKDGNRRHDRDDGHKVVTNGQEGDTKNNFKNYQGVMGKPGVDFPVLTYIPRTAFTCRGVKSGYYADLDTNCQVFHICDEGRKVSFLCPNGTIFQQSDLICDWWFKVDCAGSPALYDESAEQLHDETLKRQEARKSQEKNQRLTQPNNKPQERARPQLTREFHSQRRPANQRVEQNNIMKKDVNSYLSNHTPRTEDNSNVYKETQVPAETASFVNRKYSEQQQNYYKSVNDIGASKVTYFPQRTHADSRVIKSTTENAIVGGRVFETTHTTARPYRGRNADYLKTTTQHTIYSPTVPPYTASKFTTRFPSTKPISTKPATATTTITTSTTTTTVKPKAASGFYITKIADTTTYSPSTFSKTQSPKEQISIFDSFEKETATRPSTTFEKGTSEFTTKESGVTVPTEYRPLFSRALDNSFGTYDYTKYDFTSRSSTAAPNYFTSPLRTESPIYQSTVFTTVTPFGFSSVDTTFQADISTTESPKFTTLDDKITTNKFNQYTYLPKTGDENVFTVKPTIATPYTSYTTPQTVTDNLSNMIKTLQELDSQDPSMDIEKLVNSRPGLVIPPSAGPNTLHSLAVYFATALDNLVETNDTYSKTDKVTTTDAPQTTITEEDQLVTLLSRSTVDKYNLLFNENNTDENLDESKDSELNIKSLVEHDVHYNDLEGQQSQGPISSTPRIRQLAQVFTQALSAYLDDPDTFKKVLEEIRPTEPPQFENTGYSYTDSPQTVTPMSKEFASYTKDDDEVLDFSDTDKSSTLSTTPSTTSLPSTIYRNSTETSNEITTFPNENLNQTVSIGYHSSQVQTVNPLAIDLNTNLRYSANRQVENSTTESSYMPVETEYDEDEIKKLTAKPYGFGVRPEDSTPITEIVQNSVTDYNWGTTISNINQISQNLSEFEPFHALLPPYEVSQKTFEVNQTVNEEYLQSAHSQSFISRGNSITDRKGKALNTEDVTESTTTQDKYETTTNSPYDSTTTSFYTTAISDIETTTNELNYTSTISYTTQSSSDVSVTDSDYITTTEIPTTSDPTTKSYVPENHWSTSPIVTKLWETTLFVNPLLINRNLDIKNNDPTNSETGITTTNSYDLSTQESTYYKTTTDLVYETKYITSTTEDPISTTEYVDEELPSYPISAAGIHDLLNSTELEIASSQANQLFGNLDLNEQDLLMEKMQIAESNSTVRRLILLLVSTCDASLSKNKTVQETRNYILNALLGIPLNKSIDESKKSSKPLNSRYGRVLKIDDITPTPETSTTVEFVTSFRSVTVADKSVTLANAEVPNNSLDVKDVQQNTRALELLRSLYSLAAKWSKK